MNDIELLELLAIAEARESFWAFRRYMDPKLKIGWWQREVANVLQNFFDELMAGERPMYVIEAPPQHGKSFQILDFIAWLSGRHPEYRTIYTSFSERLGIRANLRMQRIMDSPKYLKVFPGTKLSKSRTVTNDGQSLRNREILEYVGEEGYFRNTTVRGAITGEGLDLGVIDDPIKGRAEASSKTVRDAAWDWLTDDFFTRFSEHAGLLAILTRWHVDDPIGRLIESSPQVKRFSYRALAIADEPNRKEGEALFPEHKSRDFLLARKAVMASANWEALYQQNPQILGGELIHSNQLKRYKITPQIIYRKIFADTAQKTAEHNDYSVFQCWGMGDDGRIYLLDQIRGKWEAPDLETKAVEFWNKHKAVQGQGRLRSLGVEDAASGTGLIQNVRRKAKAPIVAIDRGTQQNKLSRVMDVLGYIEAGFVCIPEDAPWVSDFTEECDAFTANDSHDHDDQVDPMVDAINDMLGGTKQGIQVSDEAANAFG
ncbi:MAG TPA: phage terminase large subunit [Pseudomonas sp.]|uniref:phage terminase large subunit n=1 Tax=Pseudomonas sp. TaxID=306 RepID=UPI002BEE16BA|nr:phage terminase large subunit [Pseudomonas sp.]HWH86173.1 phage terminase large subunit [Pseudomonas sp.]